MRHLKILIFALLGFSGCGAATGGGGVVANKAIAPTRAIHIEPVADVIDADGNLVPGSGDTISSAISEWLRKRGRIISASTTYDGYSLQAKIIHWEYHATEWNGIPNVVALSIELKEVDSGELVATATSKITGSTMTLGHHGAEELVPQVIDGGMKRLTGDGAKP